jgi:cytosine/adenosine deaminase-related metal-dependent hydrolase
VIRYRAAWILPVCTPPVRGGSILVERGRVVGIEPPVPPGAVASDAIPVVELGSVAVLPGLVNAHTHLELSWMRGRVPPAGSMPDWARRLVAIRRTVDEDDRGAIEQGIREARASGTVLVGDVSNTLASVGPLAAAGLAAVVFHELLKFATGDAEAIVAEGRRRIDGSPRSDDLRVTLAAHAPYSVSRPLFRAIRASLEPGAPWAVHAGESAEEVAFLQSGTGPWRALLEDLGAWDSRWEPPGRRPVEYLEDLGFLGPGLLAVHAVHLTDGELATLAAAGSTIVTCPRSNAWTGAGTPPIERFYGSGAEVAIGTDSLASVPDLDVFAELAALRRMAPRVPAATLLRSATLSGARALGFADRFGSLEPGKRADLLAVRVPEGIDEVEEYLVSGIAPDRLRWVGHDSAASRM